MSLAGSVFVLNSGSSSLKLELVEPDSGDVQASGIVEKIGSSDASARLEHGEDTYTSDGDIDDHRAALERALQLFADAGTDLSTADLRAVGHRVVHGGRRFSEPVLIDDDVVAAIDDLSALAPLHNPVNLAGVRAMRELLPDVPNVAVFDTAFFHDLPAYAATYAIDRGMAQRYDIRRYGFHGTSHDYVSGAAAAFLGKPREELNLIVLHLGNGASASAVRHGRAVDTTMGLTPLEGLVMGTRSGDIDPAIVAYLERVADFDVDAIDHMLNKQSGLIGLCGENDFRTIATLIAAGDGDARLAYDVYIHRLRRYLGAYLIDLGDVDAVVFTAGVGENSSDVRRDAVFGLERFGISLDAAANTADTTGPRRISGADSDTAVLVIPTNEELAIARAAATLVR